MHQERLVQRFQQFLGVLDAATGFQELFRLIGNANSNSKFIGIQVLPDHFGEVMDVHHHICIAGRLELVKRMV